MVNLTEEINLYRLWHQEEQAVLCLHSTPGEEGKEPGVVDQRRGKKAVPSNRKGMPKPRRTRAENSRGPEVCGRNKNICDGKQQELKVQR